MSVAPSAKAGDGERRAFVLDQFAPYRIVALGHAVSRRLARAYADEDLTIPEWRVLAVISQADVLAARDVVRMTPMDKMMVSRASASLEEKGYVVRAPSGEDRRVMTLSLSPTGRALFDRVAALALNYEEELLSALSAQERHVFDRALHKLSERVQNTD